MGSAGEGSLAPHGSILRTRQPRLVPEVSAVSLGRGVGGPSKALPLSALENWGSGAHSIIGLFLGPVV